nr:PAS domain-containing protein [Actinomycetota bacterium]
MSDAEMTGSAPTQAVISSPDLDATRALREAEERYRSLVEHIPAITYIYEMENAENTVFMSPQVEAILGYTPAEMLEDPDLWWDRVHVEDRERVIAETE